MSAIDDYLATITSAQKMEFERIRTIAKTTIPNMEEGMKYAMPTYIYKGKGVLSAMANKKFLSLYPFSGKVIGKLQDKLAGFELTKGSIHFSLEKPLPEKLIKEIIALRLQEIEGQAK